MSVNSSFSFCKTNLPNIVRLVVVLFILFSSFALPKGLLAYEFAHYMIDARTGKFLYGKNYEKKLHPASLTKMMTLYLAFNELTKNRMNLDDLVTISSNAALEPASKLWLSAGQRVSVRTLIRGAAIRSANDAATALAEYISGSEAKFADYMTLAARQMGMSKTVFKNAHGLTSANHLSTPKDMAILARRLMLDFPQYYNLFGRTSAQVLGKTRYNTNRRFLTSYSGSDGIKTGFTSLAGYNLAASASRGNIRIIGIIFGAGSKELRNKRMTELLDLGFARAPELSGFVPLFPLNLRPSIINQIGKNSLLNFSETPLSRPKSLVSSKKTNEIVDLQKIEEILEDVESSLMRESNGDLEAIEVPSVTFFETPRAVPPNRPKFFMETGKKSITRTEFVDESESPYKAKMHILVGFYYNKYNAEKDLPSVLLSDSSLLENVTAEISQEVFRNKAGFRIKIFPLSKTNASRACAKIRASGELCDVLE